MVALAVRQNWTGLVDEAGQSLQAGVCLVRTFWMGFTKGFGGETTDSFTGVFGGPAMRSVICDFISF